MASNELNIQQYKKMTETPIPKLILGLAAPTILSMLITSIYNLADTFFVGQISTSASGAVGVVSSLMAIIQALGFTLGHGSGTIISRSLGSRNTKAATRFASTSFFTALAVGVVLALIGLATLPDFMLLLGSTETILPHACAYARPILIAAPLMISSLVMNNILRYEGKANFAMIGLVTGGVLNIVLDPFFILPQYMNMGAAGAGLATAISNTAGTLFFLLCLLRRSSTVLSLRPCHLKRTGVYIREILSIGFPSALQYALTVVSLAVLSLFVSKYAVEAVAAYGIVKKLDNLPLYFSLGTSAGLLPFLSYNYASGDRERQRQGFVFGVSITVGFSLACVIVFELFAPQLARLFIQDDMTVAYAAAFLRRMVLCMPFVAICHPMITQFQAMGRTRESLICSILRKGSLDIPLLLLLDRLYPLYGCALVQPVVDLISLIVALVLYRRLRRTSVV